MPQTSRQGVPEDHIRGPDTQAHAHVDDTNEDHSLAEEDFLEQEGEEEELPQGG